MADVVYDAFLGSNNLRQVTNSSFDPHIKVLDGRQSGAPNVSQKFIESASPEAQLTSMDIGGFLTAFGVVGGQIADGSTVSIPWHKRASGSTFQGGSTNALVTGVAACPVQLIPQVITAPRMGPCTAQGHVHFLSGDGVTQPWTANVNSALSAQAFVAMYGLGPVYINTVRVPKQVGFSVNFGLGWSEKQHFDGAPYPSDIFTETIDPVIELTVEDFDLLMTLTGGVAITAITAYMRKRAQGGTYIADATAVHCKFSFSGGLAVPQALSAQDTKHGQAGVRLEGLSLTASSTSAVTAP